MSSTDEYKNGILEILIEHNFSNISESQLDVILTNNPDPITDCKKDLDVLSNFSINNKPCSDHKPINTSFIASKISIVIPSITKYAFKKAIWDEINNVFFNFPFDPYYYSNIDFLVKQWYKWIEDIINNNIHKFTKHRSSLPPWISKQSSFLIKKIATKKRQWPNPNIQRSIKVKRLEQQLSSFIDSDLCCFEADVFQTRRFSNIQKYLSSIRKIHQYTQ